MDAAEKLMLDLMEKHPGASESSLLALFQKVARETPEVLRLPGSVCAPYEANACAGSTEAANPSLCGHKMARNCAA